MSRKLGEVLIERGLIDSMQLKRALDLQLIYGGHLGTCLVEHGLVDVDTLGQVLAEQFSVAHAAREKLLAIDPPVLALIPAKLAERHQVVPFEVVGRTLRVAIVNPKNLLALDEIAFVSGHKIEAWVAPEILVQRALEKHYEVPRKLRHITVSGHLRGEAQASRETRPVSPGPQPKLASVAHASTEASSGAPPPSPATLDPRAQPTPPADPIPASHAVKASPLAPVEAAIESVLAAEPPDASRPLDRQADEPAPDDETRSPDPDRGALEQDALGQEPRLDEPAHYSFVEQARPRVHVDAERQDTSGTRRSIDWIKYEKEGRQAWCELFHLSLEDPHFRHLGGVYVIWHAGHHPVVRVGQGYIKTELTTLRLDARLETKDRESRLFVTWARVPREDRDGVERFLHDMLDPELRDQPPDADPLTVNLPC